MITENQRQEVLARAYVPEHLPDYVCAVSSSEPFLVGPFMVYKADEVVTLVGYPLEGEFEMDNLGAVLEMVQAQFQPGSIRLTAPQLPTNFIPSAEPDMYYRLALGELTMDKDLRYMLRRAGRELHVETGSHFGKTEQDLVRGLLRKRRLSQPHRRIFDRIPLLVETCQGVRIFRALNRRGRLVAVDVADFSADHYAFYLFNFRRMRGPVPGASDLLLGAIIEFAKAQGKDFINLGLGIDKGVSDFKQKWGGVPFLAHRQGIWQLQKAKDTDWDGLLGKL